jgi:hypothetical protein
MRDMFKCPSCGAGLQEGVASCQYCGSAIDPHLIPPKPATPEDMVEAARQMKRFFGEMTPWPVKLLFFIVPIIFLIVFLFIIIQFFRMSPF